MNNQTLTTNVINTIINEALDDKLSSLKQELTQETKEIINQAIEKQTEVIKAFINSVSDNYQTLDARLDRLEKITLT